jgi:hypothetical protein
MQSVVFGIITMGGQVVVFMIRLFSKKTELEN